MTGVVYETGSPAFERRIGTRVPIYGLDVTWIEPQLDGPSHRSPRKWRGQIDEVSVTGAAVRGPAGLLVGPAGEAVIRFCDEDTQVTVHRQMPTETPGICRYGVEFIGARPSLKAKVFEAVAPEHESPLRWDLTNA